MTTSTKATEVLAHARAEPLDANRWLVYADAVQDSGDEAGAILTRVEAQPDEDRHRLDYVQWLEGSAGRVKCPACVRVEASGLAQTDFLSHATGECYRCHSPNGTVGTVPDPVALARAELIRVQCELAREPHCVNCGGKGYMGYASYTATCKWCRPQFLKLRDRESAILAEHGDAFRRGPQCDGCDGKSAGRTAMCLACCNTGDAGGLMRSERVAHWHAGRDLQDKGDNEVWLNRVEWVRGFPVVHCTLAEAIAEERDVDCPSCFGARRVAASEGDRQVCCPTCHGRGTIARTVPSAWLRSVVTHHRGCSVLLSDVGPVHRGGVWYFPMGDHTRLPPSIDALVAKEYPSREKAVSDLSRAIPLWARVAWNGESS